MADIIKRIEDLMDLFDEGEVTTADKIQRPSDPFREFEERNPMAYGGRIGFYEAGLVTRGPRKGEYAVDTDPTQYFKTEKKANKFIKDLKEGKFRKTAAGDKFLTSSEFKKLYKSIEGKTDREFANFLNEKGFLNSKGKPFTMEIVEKRRKDLGIKSKSPVPGALTDKDILKQAKEMKLDIKGKSIDQIRRSVLESRSLEKGRTAEELKKLRDFRERKTLMAGKERQFPFNIGKKATPKDLFWKDLLDNAQRHQASILNRPGPILPESHIKFKDLNQVRPTDTKSAFKIKLVDSNVLDKKGNPKVLTYNNFLKHIDDNQKLYRIDSKTALQEYKKKRFIQKDSDLRDKFNQKLNKAYDRTSRTSRAVFSPMHIHHTAGRGRNAFNVQFAIGTENMQENALRRAFNKNFAKAKNFGEQRAALKKYLDSVPPNLEVRLKNTPYGQRETLIDMTKRVAPELEQQVRAAGGAELGSIDKQFLADAAKFAGRAAQAGFLTPTGVAASTLGLGGLDLTSPVGRLTLGAELAAAPELVKASIGATRGMKNRALQKGIQQFLNLGLPTRLALKAARVASPIGIASLAGEGLYQAGKFAKKRMGELQAMSPEQRRALRARQAALAFEGAREGGIIGKKSGPPPVSGPTPHGLPYETKGVKKQ
jgi:hypothetical protein